MKQIKGNIYRVEKNCFEKGILFYDDFIREFVADPTIKDDCFILPGLIDAHVHIESSMMSPVEFAKECVKHGVIGIVSDPHEIANVCGLDGVQYMVNCAKLTPVKISTGAPSCVPATNMETSGAVITENDIGFLFKNEWCSHLSEMMNFPGVIYDDQSVLGKINVAKQYNKVIDGHAPMLSGTELEKYCSAGITTDHECVTLYEAHEKIHLGMKIMLRESSASKDFDNLLPLLSDYPGSVMFCTDDCHPDDLQNGYIEKLFRKAIKAKYPVDAVIKGASLNAINHYNLNIGTLKLNDPADFIVVDTIEDFTVLQTVIDGKEIFDGKDVSFNVNKPENINTFYCNEITIEDIQIERIPGKKLNVIEVIPNSLVTAQLVVEINSDNEFINANIEQDILKIVVVNRYQKAKPTVGFIKGFELKHGAIGGSVAHDSHNIVVVGTNDNDIIKAIHMIQKGRGGLVAISNDNNNYLPLPIAGLMSDMSCQEIALAYKDITNFAKSMGSTLNSPFMTLAFMALLVIPQLKIGDKGLFNISNFSFVDLQS